MSWDKLREVYKDKGLALVLGAGISRDSCIPTWVDLLRRLAQVAGMNPDDTVDGLRTRGYSLPTIAAIIQAKFGSRSEFIESARDELYATFPYYSSDPGDWDKKGLVEFVHRKAPNLTLRTVGAFCAAPSDRGFESNSRVRAVATLNIDYLLQAYTRARYDRRLLRTVERASASSSMKRTNLFHLHGLLRFDVGTAKSGRLDRSKEAPDGVVLTEHDYFDFFNAPNSMFNYTFLFLLREYSCLFVGSSMTDDNIRRLLYYSSSERRRHLLAEGEDEDEADRRALRHFAILEHSSGVQDQLIESSLASLGVTPLWLDRYSELPTRLGHIYEATDTTWEAVFK